MSVEARLQLSELVQFEQDEEDSDGVLVDTSSGEIFACNASAVCLVREMVAGSSMERLVRLLVERYRLDRSTAEKDIHALLESLAARGFLAGSSGPLGIVE